LIRCGSDLASRLGPIDIGPCSSIYLQFNYSHGQRPNASFSVRCEYIPISYQSHDWNGKKFIPPQRPTC